MLEVTYLVSDGSGVRYFAEIAVRNGIHFHVAVQQ
jgi:hypothetical protein